MTFIFCPG